MTFSDGCPCGRSQLFTFKAKETITVDRPTLEHIFVLLNGCSANFKYGVAELRYDTGKNTRGNPKMIFEILMGDWNISKF
jgi:hypothetical protein